MDETLSQQALLMAEKWYRGRDNTSLRKMHSYKDKISVVVIDPNYKILCRTEFVHTINQMSDTVAFS